MLEFSSSSLTEFTNCVTRVAVARPTLPTELLIEIVSLVAHTPAFDFLQPHWGDISRVETLHALSLSSRAFCKIATPLLYAHPVLRTPRAGRALVRTLRSPKWTTGAKKGNGTKWVKGVSLGGKVEGDAGFSTGDVCLVLAALGGAQLERVEVAGAMLGIGAFQGIQIKWTAQLGRLASRADHD